jgi:thiamine biosynthesis lipoprotein
MMGTFVTVSIDCRTATEANVAFRHVFAEMRRMAALMNHCDPCSEISRLNSDGLLPRAAADTLAVIRKALYFSALSGGAFDISVLPLVHLWGSDACRDGNCRSAAAASVDYRSVLIDDDSVRLLRPRMQIVLAGIAKGYIVDKAISVLQDCGVTRAMVNGGGDIRAIGSRAGPPWRIGVSDPFRPKRILHILEARDIAVASGGAYAHAYNDIIDPRTGAPARGVAGVSVIAEEASTADALATCLTVLGPAAGLALIEQQENPRLAALLVSDAGEQHKTANWAHYCA